MKKLFCMFLSLSLLCSTAFAINENSNLSDEADRVFIESHVDDLISGNVYPVIEDEISDFGIFYENLQTSSYSSGTKNMSPVNDNSILDVRGLGPNKYVATAITPLTRSDSDADNGVTIFVSVVYYRTNANGMSYVKISTVLGGWRHTNNSNIVLKNIDLNPEN